MALVIALMVIAMFSLIYYLKTRILKSFKVTFTLLFILINITVVSVNTVYINQSIEQQNDSLVMMIEHLLYYTNDETVITYLEHYGHTHDVALHYQTLDLQYTHTTAQYPSDQYGYDVFFNNNHYATITIDNAQSNLFQQNLTYLLIINILLIILYICFLFLFNKRLRTLLNTTANDLEMIQNAIKSIQFNQAYTYEEFQTIEDAFKETYLKIEQLQQTHHQTIQALAHDIKTPLTIIKGLIEGLRSNRIVLDDSIKQSIDEEISKLSTLVDTIINGPEENTMKPLNFSKIIQQSLNRHDIMFKEKALTVDQSIEKKVIIRGNKNDLRRLIDHIIQNAITHTPSNHTIYITLTPHMLTIKDEGSGFKKSALKTLYKNSKSEKGTGVGLKIVKAICDAHNFNLNIDSQRNGSKVTITFDS